MLLLRENESFKPKVENFCNTNRLIKILPITFEAGYALKPH